MINFEELNKLHVEIQNILKEQQKLKDRRQKIEKIRIKISR